MQQGAQSPKYELMDPDVLPRLDDVLENVTSENATRAGLQTFGDEDARIIYEIKNLKPGGGKPWSSKDKDDMDIER